ncbi:MAG TPA: hypothetical protein VJR58_16085 [Vineibacter sp.]|nr:hypothetical protein [Vineibacter sp.]
MQTRLAAGLVAANLALAGCYETDQGVLTQGAEVTVSPGTYRCRSERDREVSIATISAPALLKANDVVYVATLDKNRYVVRIVPLSDGLLLLEGRDESRRAYPVFARRRGTSEDYDLLVTAPAARDRLAALAATHGVKIAFPPYGPPRISGTPDRQRAFLMAHTPAELQRTAICRRTR